MSEATAGPTPGTVMIGDKPVGSGHPTYVIGEIGINHNGDLDIARQLIDIAADAGCDAVKFQKRTPEICVPAEQRDVMRDTPWGRMTYLDYRYRVEFEEDGYREIDVHCAKRGVHWFASPWDVPSVAFLEGFDVVTHKVASASVTDLELLARGARHRQAGHPLDRDVHDRGDRPGGRDPRHRAARHPARHLDLPAAAARGQPADDPTLAERYGVPVGYSGHERGLQISIAAVALGAVAVERHITLDRTMWGSDQAASLEPEGLRHLVRDIRIIHEAMGDGVKRVFDGEQAPRAASTPSRLTPVPRAAADSSTVGWVESPFQLLGAVEAQTSGALGRHLVVLPRAGGGAAVADGRRAAAAGAAARCHGVEPEPCAAPGRRHPGDRRRVLRRGAPDAGARPAGPPRARGRRPLDAPRHGGAGQPAHPADPAARGRLAGAGAARPGRAGAAAAAGAHRPDARWSPPSTCRERVLDAARNLGIDVRRHEFEWLRSLPVTQVPGSETVVLGTSLVANNLVKAAPYVEWVQAIAREAPVTYWAHRREDARTLGPLGRTPGIEITARADPGRAEPARRHLAPADHAADDGGDDAAHAGARGQRPRVRGAGVLVEPERAGGARGCTWCRTPTTSRPSASRRSR